MTGGCVVNGVVVRRDSGRQNCSTAGGTVNTPWGQRQVHWGMLTAVRDSNGAEAQMLLGNSHAAVEDRLVAQHAIQAHQRLRALDKTFGNKIYNEGSPLVVGRLHDVGRAAGRQDGRERQADRLLLARSCARSRDRRRRLSTTCSDRTRSRTRTASYTKLRELSVSYNVGAIPKTRSGNWSVTASAATCTRGPSTRVGIRTSAAAADSAVGRTARAAVLELPADPQFHAHAFLQVLTAIGGLARAVPRASRSPRPQETR